MIRKTLRELAETVNGVLSGDPSVVITGVAGVREAESGDITFVDNGRYARLLERSRASAAVVEAGFDGKVAMPLIRVKDADEAFSRIVQCFAPPALTQKPGVHPTAVVAPDARLGKGVFVGAHAVIESGASVGEGSVIHPHVYVGHGVSVGKGCLIYPNVTLRERVVVGDRCIIHSGSVIGSDGFGYVTKQGRHEKIPQMGTVVIEEDVEIGSCVTVDRARFGRTQIGKGTKIDNLVQIAHNVVIGENCLIVSMVGLCGSARVGNNVVLAGKSGVDGHVAVGDNVVIGGLAGVTKDVADGMCVSGFPAQEHEKELKLAAALHGVPRLIERVKELEKKLRELEHPTDHPR